MKRILEHPVGESTRPPEKLDSEVREVVLINPVKLAVPETRPATGAGGDLCPGDTGDVHVPARKPPVLELPLQDRGSLLRQFGNPSRSVSN